MTPISDRMTPISDRMTPISDRTARNSSDISRRKFLRVLRPAMSPTSTPSAATTAPAVVAIAVTASQSIPNIVRLPSVGCGRRLRPTGCKYRTGL